MRDRKYNTYRITDGAAVVGRRGGPEGSDGGRWGRYPDGPLVNGDFGWLHADPVRAVVLSEGWATEETEIDDQVYDKTKLKIIFIHYKCPEKVKY